LEHRLAAVPELANRVLRVIVTKDEPKRVITAHLDRKMKEWLTRTFLIPGVVLVG
jgi:hypothetical protein